MNVMSAFIRRDIKQLACLLPFFSPQCEYMRRWSSANQEEDIYQFSLFSSVAQSCPTLCNPMDHSTLGLPVHHQLRESTQTHVHCVGDAIQPSHPVIPFSSCPQSLPASGYFQMSQLSASGGQSIGVSAFFF